VVSKEKAQKWAATLGDHVGYHEVSAKHDVGVADLAQLITAKCVASTPPDELPAPVQQSLLLEEAQPSVSAQQEYGKAFDEVFAPLVSTFNKLEEEHHVSEKFMTIAGTAATGIQIVGEETKKIFEQVSQEPVVKEGIKNVEEFFQKVAQEPVVKDSVKNVEELVQKISQEPAVQQGLKSAEEFVDAVQRETLRIFGGTSYEYQHIS